MECRRDAVRGSWLVPAEQYDFGEQRSGSAAGAEHHVRFVELESSGDALDLLDATDDSLQHLNDPTAVAFDSARDLLYIADTGSNVIREISHGNISTVAGDMNKGP